MEDTMHFIRNAKLYTPEGEFITDVTTDPTNPEETWVRWLKDPRNKSFRVIIDDQNFTFTAIKEYRKHRSGNSGAYWFGHVRLANNRLRHYSLGSLNPPRDKGKPKNLYVNRITWQKICKIGARLQAAQLADGMDKETRRKWQRRQKARKSGDPPRRIMPGPARPEPPTQPALFDVPESKKRETYHYDR